MPLILGASGIFTPVIESAATAIGAGVMLGAFAGASSGLAHRRSRRQVEEGALRDSYSGGAGVLGFWILDQCIVYAASI